MGDTQNEMKKSIESNVKTLQASMRDAAEATTQKASAAISNGLAEASAGVEKTQAQIASQMEKVMKTAEELASFHQGTLEAVMKAGQIWTAGLQDLGKQVAATAQTQMTETMSTLKTLSGLRSLKDMMDLQANYTRAAMEKAMSETGRLTDASFKLAEQTMAPLTERVSVAVSTFSKAA